MATVRLDGVVKRYGEAQVIHAIDLDIADGEFVVLVGPSGCGKSTLLRMIAGLETISGGELVIGGARANEVPPQKRNIAMVFQSYALYPHMTARQNIAYGPRLRGEARPEIEAKVGKAAGILNLFDYLERLPRQLSGGQRQRVAMGRAIVRDPAVFLFDEPLSNLDAKLRVQMRTEIKALHRRLGTTIVYVTHDQIEAMTLADRIVVMNGGRIEQQGKPLDLYDLPANTFVAGFLGSPAMSFLPGRYRRGAEGPVVEAEDGTRLPAPDRGAEDDQPVLLGVRPEHFTLAEGAGGVPVTIDLVEPTGAETHLYGTLAGTRIAAVMHGRRPVAPGDVVPLAPLAAHAHLFDAASGRRL
ncbi:ABC transporter ATP-binding protein [Inquilinus sp. Marseille-Q2685]|uniref:ABC transporter ATP-binding protein n=1 Tax=Inquilinus sp. Marseille-Q2685 TaxID=2866581 RepID=UPI001CE3F89B|nr:sn-glycerol-3-phosphate ABC transporter ATP-binding protein UgpC [Inquilinus sp. Marseille-Q2685]